jgi:hypothetical protein
MNSAWGVVLAFAFGVFATVEAARHDNILEWLCGAIILLVFLIALKSNEAWWKSGSMFAAVGVGHLFGNLWLIRRGLRRAPAFNDYAWLGFILGFFASAFGLRVRKQLNS